MEKPSKIGKREWKRLQNLLRFEKEALSQGYTLIAGIDEVGRGPLAGPVVAVACHIPPDIFLPGIDDSKKLLPEEREELFNIIQAEKRIIYGIGSIDSNTIDKINIHQATFQAMLQAVINMAIQPDCLLVDGLKLPHPAIPVIKIIGGDALSQSIAAASVIAKVTRDRLMLEFHKQWPQYGFDKHKGYSTEMHKSMLQKFGPSPIHRMSYEPVRNINGSSRTIRSR